MRNRLLAKTNAVIEAYFKGNPNIRTIPAKNLMPQFIEAGIFRKGHRGGLPIRKILRELDNENSLNLIPYVRPERKQKNTYWYSERRNI